MGKLRILIVDDEKIERNGMRFLFKQMGYELDIAEANNGRDALEYIKANDLDILLTDIKMPFMDGLELIGNVVKIKPELKIIIFSGHNDFEYAKEAMKSGVSDYILKPVDPKEFKATIDKVISEVAYINKEKDIKEKSKQFLEEHLLYMLVNGTTVKELEGGVCEIVDTAFISTYTRLILIEFNSDFFGRFEEFAEKIYEKYPKGIKYLNLNLRQAIIFFDDTKLDEKLLAKEIYEFVHANYAEKCFLAISSHIDDIKDLSKALDEAELLMENKFYQSGEYIFMSGHDENTSPVIAQIEDDTLMKQMKQDIKMKDISGLKEHFMRLCEKYRNKTDFSQVYIKFIFSNLLKDFYENLPDAGEKKLNEEIDRLYRSNDFTCVMDIINRNIELLEKAFAVNPQMIHREIETVKQYIYSHYGEEIGVEQLAAMVYMAPSYLSCVFKKETGQNLSKFIKAYRMEKAKEMLEDSHNKIVNISMACGYPNVSYFCQSFREYFGVSPQKFRNTGEE